MSTKKAVPENINIHINNRREIVSDPFAQQEDQFVKAVSVITKEREELRLQTELQADCIRRQDAQIRELERGVSVSYHNGRPDRVIVDSTAVLEYASKYMKE